MAVTWNYNGGTGSLTATINDAVNGDHYLLAAQDADSSPVDQVASGSSLMLTVTGIGGDSAGYLFAVFLYHGDSSGVVAGADECVYDNIFAEGTSSTTGEGQTVTWSYNGTTSVAVTITAAGGVTYNLSAWPDGAGSQDQNTYGPFTDGTTQILTLTTSSPSPSNRSFYAWLANDSTGDSYSVRVFVGGTAGIGSPGSPGGGTPIPAVGAGRVWIAFDDGPLEPDPTFTVIDQGGDFPVNFVAGYDIRVGRQTLLTQTDTGTATVTLYDRSGLFDPRNVSSPYYGKLDGRQILLQLYNPVSATWEPQFRGLIDDIEWAVDGSAVNASGEPVNETITLNCVDVFDYLAGYGLTPGLDGVTPPVGAEDGVYYAATTGSVDDRIIEILTDANIDSAMWSVASGNVHAKEVKYDPDESALQALRDAADAELPFIANIYCDRYGHFAFRGRYGRFDPDDVAAEPGSDWDFTRWAVGDGPAIIADPTRAQMRILSFGRARSELVNAALCYPQGIKPADMPGQVFADTTSITDYGKHSAPPMSDLLCDGGVDTAARPSGTTDLVETALFAELLVKNQKDPRENITAIQLKSMQPDHTPRATATWDMLSRIDISHVVNVAIGYPGGTGFTGMATVDDYYIEGRQLHVTPANSGYDYVELDLDLSAAVWSMDTHNVFPDFPG